MALEFKLEDFFAPSTAIGARTSINSRAFTRMQPQRTDGAEMWIDRFSPSRAAAGFLRVPASATGEAVILLRGGYQVEACLSGGWLLRPQDSHLDSYWVPQPPWLRRLDQHGHILTQHRADISNIRVSPSGMCVKIPIVEDHVLDFVLWLLPAHEPDLASSLRAPSSLERQRYFLWSSHTAFERPADLYLHMVHGLIYENHAVWPKYWRVCSELDAYALYITLGGVLRATGKRLYALLRTQIVFSVIARQAEDGGWYHGEWTDGMESHYRLHAGAMHLLAACFEETQDPVVRAALERSAAFASAKTDRLQIGQWYLHDSLEENAETVRQYPFRLISSRALGKSASNVLVLNTHLDTNIAMERHRRVTGDARHEKLIASARATSRAVINLRPAEWLYRLLFVAIRLTFLPADRARALPLPLRAVKRIASNYLIPQLPRIKALFPRLVMPGGYIERDLVQFGFSVRYQPVNLMDLIRTRRLFDEATLDGLLETSFAFTEKCGIKDRWKASKGKEDDALGFWAEALYHLCLAKPNPLYRAWLAVAMLDLEDNCLGLSPSLLGANTEAVAAGEQWPCPSPTDIRLRLANLSRAEVIELLVVNPTDAAINLEWETPPSDTIVWQRQDGTTRRAIERVQQVPPRGWLHGVTNVTARS